MTEEKQLDIGLLILRVSLGITFIGHGGIFLFLCCIVVYLVGPGKYTLTHIMENR